MQNKIKKNRIKQSSLAPNSFLFSILSNCTETYIICCEGCFFISKRPMHRSVMQSFSCWYFFQVPEIVRTYFS